MNAAKFLFVTMPVTGHVSPLLPLAKELVGRDHEVRWYTSSRFKRRIQETGAYFIPYQTARDINYDDVNALFPERAELRGIAQAKYDMKRLIVDAAFDQSLDVGAILDDFSADVVVGGAKVLYDASKTSRESIVDAVRNAGYQVVGYV